jgi:hypothetical protein
LFFGVDKTLEIMNDRIEKLKIEIKELDRKENL